MAILQKLSTNTYLTCYDFDIFLYKKFLYTANVLTITKRLIRNNIMQYKKTDTNHKFLTAIHCLFYCAAIAKSYNSIME